MRSYDNWKTTDPGDEELGPDDAWQNPNRWESMLYQDGLEDHTPTLEIDEPECGVKIMGYWNKKTHERLEARMKEVEETFSIEQLEKRIKQLDQELKATGWTTLSEKRKRGKLAREITACGLVYGQKWAGRSHPNS